MSIPDHCDPVMLDLFRAEMDTHLPALSQGLLLVEKGHAGEKDFEAMMRAAHSIKGAARIVGIDLAIRLAHAMEDCFSAAQTRRLILSSASVDVLLQGVDTLQRICSDQPESPLTPELVDSLLAQLVLVREGPPPEAGTRPAPPPDVSPGVVPLVSSGESPQSSITLPLTLDDVAAESLRCEFVRILEERPSRLRLDFSAMQQLSARGLSLLASVAHHIDRRESAPVIEMTGVSRPMATLLQTTGLDRVFRLPE